MLKKFLIWMLLSYVNGYTIDLSSVEKLEQQAITQTYTKDRIHVENSELYVYMKPLDGDGLTGLSRTSHRQRDEILINVNECVSQNNKPITYKTHIKMMENMNWFAKINAWYHVYQIKLHGRNRPLLTVGIKNENLVLYNCDGFYPIIIGNIHNYWNRWLYIKIHVVPDKNNIKIYYTFEGKTGQITCIKNMKLKKIIYLKLGQYRSYPNTITDTTITMYKNIICN